MNQWTVVCAYGHRGRRTMMARCAFMVSLARLVNVFRALRMTSEARSRMRLGELGRISRSSLLQLDRQCPPAPHRPYTFASPSLHDSMPDHTNVPHCKSVACICSWTGSTALLALLALLGEPGSFVGTVELDAP